MEEVIYVTGKPIIQIFHNPTNFFTILKIKVKETNGDWNEKELTVTGSFPQLTLEESYRFTGHFSKHPKFGHQFNAATFEKEMPSTESGLVHYLSGELFPGIGKKTAQTVIDTLGKNAIQKIVKDPSVLDQVPRLSEERKTVLQTVLQEHLGMEKTIVQLSEWGFGPQLAMRIYQRYKDETITIIEENPYQLVLEVKGVGFQTADELGRRLGIEEDHLSRLQAAIHILLNEYSMGEGHVYLPQEYLLFLTYELISKHSSVTIPSERFVEALEQLIQLGTVIQENDRIYLPSLYASEVGIATHFERALSGEVKEVFPQAAVTSAIGKVEERLGVNYARSQIEAIEQAIHSPLMILTGGPGTGKTTVIQGIVEVFAELRGYSLDPSTYVGKDEGFPIVLAAPTGRAAKRMNESTGLPAMTIHRLLGFTGQEEEDDFEGREVSGELIIIDEMSMVDNWLAYQLMKAIPKDAQLLLVGDEDQLPSVGPGQVLKDLIASRELPVIELTEIFRQSEDSSIIQLAHQMKTDRPILDLTAKKKDRSFIPAESYQVPKVVEQIVTSAIEKGFSIQEIQVLAPMYRGEAGINRLNQQIQDAVNPKSERARELQFGETVYRVGDKVLQLVNQPESNVFNGDIGEIVAIFYANENVDKKDQLVVQFDQNEVVYEKRDLNQLTLAYCTSIHKAQGSEFSLVIMPIVRGFQKMLRKNLLYTGITRAKRFLIMVGEEYAWTTGLTRSDELNRYTTLKERLAGTLYDDMPTVSNEGEEETSFVLQMNQLYTIDPMIGMEGVTPFDFLEK